jgi:GTP1/Obg family GTP-binding protein
MLQLGSTVRNCPVATFFIAVISVGHFLQTRFKSKIIDTDTPGLLENSG